jgi:hypothetical protein
LLAGYLEESHIITEKMLNNLAEELERDLVGGRPTLQARTDQDGDLGQMIDGRLRSLEQAVARHDRVLKRTLEITARLLIETGT